MRFIQYRRIDALQTLGGADIDGVDLSVLAKIPPHFFRGTQIRLKKPGENTVYKEQDSKESDAFENGAGFSGGPLLGRKISWIF